GFIQGETRNLVAYALCRQIVLWGVGQRQLPETMFDNSFPDADHAQIDGVPQVTDAVAPVGRKPTVPTDEPEKNVRIKEKPHRPSKACRRSSGNGASKSSGTVNSPAHKPNGRRASAPVLTGFISTTGCPARTITSVSPASTR